MVDTCDNLVYTPHLLHMFCLILQWIKTQFIFNQKSFLMIKTTITPQQTDIYLSVPQDYVGRKLEILLYPIDEIIKGVVKEVPKRKASEYKGILSKEEAGKFLK